MKIVIGVATALLLLLWTLGAWVTAQIAGWLGAWAGSGQSADWASVAGTVRLPAWITEWLDPATISSIFDAAVRAMEAAGSALPWLASISSWLTALVWLCWGAGALLLVGVAAVAYAAVARFSRAPPVALAG